MPHDRKGFARAQSLAELDHFAVAMSNAQQLPRVQAVEPGTNIGQRAQAGEVGQGQLQPAENLVHGVVLADHDLNSCQSQRRRGDRGASGKIRLTQNCWRHIGGRSVQFGCNAKQRLRPADGRQGKHRAA